MQHPVFRALWLATLVSNIGTFMQSVGAAWLMTSLSTSPVMVALVQAASIFPMFLLALPAGALADIIDRRRLLLATQAWMMVAAALLAALTLLGAASPWVLLGFTFLLGLGAAMNAPAWQAIVPELVPRAELTQAISLNSAGFNLSRAVGPALGGAIVAAGRGRGHLYPECGFFPGGDDRPVPVAAAGHRHRLAGRTHGRRHPHRPALCASFPGVASRSLADRDFHPIFQLSLGPSAPGGPL